MLPLHLLLVLATTFDVTTVADRTDLVETGRIAEIGVICQGLKGVGQGCETFGQTPEGRPMLAWVLSSVPAARRTNSAAFKNRPTVLLIGGIHAGEIDGKDATIAIVKELLNGALPGVLDAVTVVVVPVYNVDGHERFGKNHRPNQRGPAETGWRVNAQNLNLNRDWVKADAPETRAMVGLMNRYDPVVVVDLHVTDGAQFRHDISVLTEPWQDDGTQTPLMAAAAKVSTTLQAHLTATGHLPLDFYPAFEVDDDPASGFSRGVVPARFTHGYVAQRGRIGVLVETHSWQPYKARVKATIDVLEGFLRLAISEAASWRRAADDVDRLRSTLPGTSVIVRFDSDPATTHTIDFLGYAYTRTPSAVSGGLWTQYDETTPAVWKIPLVEGVKPAQTTTAPTAYAVLPGFAAPVVERLKAHGIAFTLLGEVHSLDGETFHADAVTLGTASYEGRQTAKVEGAWSKTTTTLPPGTVIVPVAQPLGRVVIELMEPGARESFVGWGFFNARFEQKEYMEAYVAEVIARELLKDPQVKAAFETRLKADEAFAKNPEARLDFFYRRHPAFDSVMGVLPVLRLATLPGAASTRTPTPTTTTPKRPVPTGWKPKPAPPPRR